MASRVAASLAAWWVLPILFSAAAPVATAPAAPSHAAPDALPSRESDLTGQAARLNDLYDRTYSDLYDVIWMDYFRYADEIRNLGDFITPSFDVVAAKEGNGDSEGGSRVPRATRVVDVGCGTGIHVNMLREYAVDAQVDLDITGFDVSTSQLARAATRNPATTFVQGSYLNHSALPAGHFDNVMCMYDACFYTPRLRDVLTSLARWVKPGGVVTLHGIDRSSVYENTCTFAPEAYEFDGVVIQVGREEEGERERQRQRQRGRQRAMGCDRRGGRGDGGCNGVTPIRVFYVVRVSCPL